MSISVAQKQMHEGTGRLTGLETLLQVMEIAAIAQESMESSLPDTDIYWPALIAIARRELDAAIDPLEEAEILLNKMWGEEMSKGESA